MLKVSKVLKIIRRLDTLHIIYFYGIKLHTFIAPHELCIKHELNMKWRPRLIYSEGVNGYYID